MITVGDFSVVTTNRLTNRDNLMTGNRSEYQAKPSGPALLSSVFGLKEIRNCHE